MFPETADAHGRSTFSDFRAIAASSADRFEVPRGFRADVLIAWGDKFADRDGNVLEYGFNNDFLAFFPLGSHGHDDEGILFVNHEYPSPFYQHGFRANAAGVAAGKTAEQVAARAAARSATRCCTSAQDRNGRLDGRLALALQPPHLRRPPRARRRRRIPLGVTGPLRGDSR